MDKAWLTGIKNKEILVKYQLWYVGEKSLNFFLLLLLLFSETELHYVAQTGLQFSDPPASAF